MAEDPKQPAPPPAPRPGPARLQAPSGRLLDALLLALVAVAAAWLLVPPAEQLPGPEALGTVATATIRADRDYDVIDQEATARRRVLAAAAVRPIYDHDEGAPGEAAARIHAAFQFMRDEQRAAGDRRLPEAELLRRLLAQQDGLFSRLQVVVRPDDLAALAAARFAEPVEQALAGLAARGLDGLVIEDRLLLPADREGGLVVRSFQGGVLTGERAVADLSLIRDLAAAREEVRAAAEVRLRGEPPALRAALARVATALVRPTLEQDQAGTARRREEAAAQVRPVALPVKRGERIVSAGEPIEPRHLALLEAMRAQRAQADRSQQRLGTGLLVALLVAALWRFARGALPGFRPGRRDRVLLAALLLAGVAAAAAGARLADLAVDLLPGVPRQALLALLPLAAGALVAREVLSAEAALLVAVATAAVAGLLAGESMPLALHALVTSLAAAAAGRPGGRGGLPWAGAAAGLAGALLAGAMGLAAGRPAAELGVGALGAALGGLVAVPLAAALLLSLLEALLGYATARRLRALANLNHPALKELIVQAPGTYHHAVVSGALAEAAARAVGADPLLARVGAYYHDVGKTRNPLFFGENQRGENRHEGLAPTMSALVVRRHVTDGLELGRRWRLPRPVLDIIAQHHGTRLVGAFWAKHQAAVGAAQAEADRAAFRYPGPRPRSREAALVMIADACEGSARGVEGASTAELARLVERRIAEIVEEGQLEECPLTLRDLSAAAAAMAAELAALGAARPATAPRPGEAAPPMSLVGRP